MVLVSKQNKKKILMYLFSEGIITVKKDGFKKEHDDVKEVGIPYSGEFQFYINFIFSWCLNVQNIATHPVYDNVTQSESTRKF